MATRTVITEKSTAPVVFQLLESGLAFGMQGIPIANVTLLLSDSDEVSSTIPNSALAYVSAAQGQVSYTPAATDLVAARGPYTARFKVTDVNSAIKYFPSGLRDIWEIAKE